MDEKYKNPAVAAVAVIDGNDRDAVEKKAAALQRSAALLKDGGEYEKALKNINSAIKLLENTDFLFETVSRGELWADRWNLLVALNRAAEAEKECDGRIAAYTGDDNLKGLKISYLYYGYRFKAQLAAKRGATPQEVKDVMRRALRYIEVPAAYQKGLDEAFRPDNLNTAFLLVGIDKATPRADLLNWDI